MCLLLCQHVFALPRKIRHDDGHIEMNADGHDEDFIKEHLPDVDGGFADDPNVSSSAFLNF